jgi:L-amino acid N-acyltransferase YncA
LLIRALSEADWPAVAAIYEQGIATRNATFETSATPWEEWDAAHLEEHRLVAEEGGRVVGWAALSPVSDRCCYAGVAENSVYVAADAQGRGVGRALLEALIAGAEAAGIWTIETGIFPENEASVALHERCGFRIVGVRERRGQLDGQWRDVLLLERRSGVIGAPAGPVPIPHPPEGMEKTVAPQDARGGADFVPTRRRSSAGQRARTVSEAGTTPPRLRHGRS